MKRNQDNLEQEEKYANLRRLALSTSSRDLGLSVEHVNNREVFGALMEFALSGASVTLFCTASGDASLYTSRGFGVVGGFAHDRVRSAARAFVDLCEQHRSEMIAVDLFPRPHEGMFCVYALTRHGVLGFESAMSSSSGEATLVDVREAGHVVIAELRKLTAT